MEVDGWMDGSGRLAGVYQIQIKIQIHIKKVLTPFTYATEIQTLVRGICMSLKVTSKKSPEGIKKRLQKSFSIIFSCLS